MKSVSYPGMAVVERIEEHIAVKHAYKHADKEVSMMCSTLSKEATAKDTNTGIDSVSDAVNNSIKPDKACMEAASHEKDCHCIEDKRCLHEMHPFVKNCLEKHGEGCCDKELNLSDCDGDCEKCKFFTAMFSTSV